jgi:hypothetical protein
MIKIKETWSGRYEKDNKEIELVFKNFICPPEGGDISG